MNRRQFQSISLLLAGVLGFGVEIALAQSQSPAIDRIDKQKTLRVGWAVWHPYIYRDPKTNQLQGISYDLIEDMGKAMGVKVTWVEDSWATLPAGLQAGKFEITNLMAVTPPREQVVTFSAPVTRHGLSLLAPRDEVAKSKSWQDWDRAGVKITVTLGSVGDMFVTEKFKKAEIVRLKTFPENILALQSGRVNALGATLDALKVLEKQYPQFAIAPNSYGSSEVAFAVSKGDEALASRVNKVIGEEKRSGRIKHLLDKHGLDASFAVE